MFPTQQRQPGPPAPGPNPAAGPAPAPPGGAPGAPQPQFQGQVDPRNPLQKALLMRVDRLLPQDLQALNTGIAPPAVAVLKKVLPEIGFLLDMIGKPDQGGAPGAAPGGDDSGAAGAAAGAAAAGAGAPPPPPGPSRFQQMK